MTKKILNPQVVKKYLFSALLVFTTLVYTVTRFYNLGYDFVGFDAYYFKDWSYVFMKELENGNLKYLPRTIQPGAITIYSNIIGFKLLYFASDKLHIVNITNTDLYLHIFQKVPKVLFITGVLAAATYLIAKLYNKYIALVFLALVSTEPLIIAHTRATQTDATQAVLMLLSTMLLVSYFKYKKLVLVVLSGIVAGVSFIEKSPSILLIPSSIFILLYFIVLNKSCTIKEGIKITAIYLLSFGLSSYSLYPLFWYNFTETIKTTTLDAFLFGAKGLNTETGSMDKYVSSRATDLVYFNTLIYRHSLTFISSTLLAIWVFIQKKLWKKIDKFIYLITPIIYLIALQLSEKKFDRYFIIITIFLCLFIAQNIYEVFNSKLAILFTYTAIVVTSGLLLYSSWTSANIIGYVNVLSKDKYIPDWGMGYKTLGQELREMNINSDTQIFLSDYNSLKPFFESTKLQGYEKYRSENCLKSDCLFINPEKKFIENESLILKKSIDYRGTYLFKIYNN